MTLVVVVMLITIANDDDDENNNNNNNNMTNAIASYNALREPTSGINVKLIIFFQLIFKIKI